MTKNKYHIKSRVWICTESGTYLGEGRIALLKAVDVEGSISKGAKKLDMSYKKAWELVNSMNQQSDYPLVERTIGGQGGGGTVVTDAGKEAIHLFEQLKESLENKMEEEIKSFNL